MLQLSTTVEQAAENLPMQILPAQVMAGRLEINLEISALAIGVISRLADVEQRETKQMLVRYVLLGRLQGNCLLTGVHTLRFVECKDPGRSRGLRRIRTPGTATCALHERNISLVL